MCFHDYPFISLFRKRKKATCLGGRHKYRKVKKQKNSHKERGANTPYREFSYGNSDSFDEKCEVGSVDLKRKLCHDPFCENG